MTTAIYHANPPGPLMARLCYTFPLGTQFVSYPRQEAPMATATTTDRDALYADFYEHVYVLRELLRQAAAREQCIRDVWTELEALEAAPQRGQRAAGGEN